MKITFLGGTQTVTGSKFLVEAGNTRVLVDCGLFQGFKWLRERNRQPLSLNIESLDTVLLESTYGNRRHPASDPCAQLAEAVRSTAQRSGADSILRRGAGSTAAAYAGDPDGPRRNSRNAGLYGQPDDHRCLRYLLPLSQHRLTPQQCKAMCQVPTYTRSVDASKALAGQAYPHIIIAGSGMASGGRILHHFKRLLGDPKTTVLFTGYQAGGTRSAKMTSGAESVKIHGKWVPMRAGVRVLAGLSGHGDYLELAEWLGQSALQPDTAIQLVHGEPEALEGMRDHLGRHTTFRAEVARNGSTLTL